jgi:hypothetical protein
MLQDAHARLRPILQRRDHGFRWRGHEVSRIEGLSDVVFGFCLTLLVVSLEAPKSYAELRHMMNGFASFALCFVVLVMIWHSQYIYFRRYALDDLPSFVLNAALLLVVTFYVYPLKFLFNTLVAFVMGSRDVGASGQVLQAMARGDWRGLMIIFSGGFIALYVIFALLYRHAYRMRETLGLSPMEAHETRGVVQEHLLMIAIGGVALVLAIVNLAPFAGLVYVLISPAQMWLGTIHGKRRAALEQAPSLEAASSS